MLATELLDLVEPIPQATWFSFVPQARQAFGRENDADVPYLAAALAVDADAIWSHDQDFDVQDLVPRIRWP